MQYILAKIDDTNMLYVTGWEDWGRVRQGGRNTEANMLMYHTLITGSKLAAWIGDPYLAQTWGDLAVKLKAAVNKNNFDFKVGLVETLRSGIASILPLTMIQERSRRVISMVVFIQKMATVWRFSLMALLILLTHPFLNN